MYDNKKTGAKDTNFFWRGPMEDKREKQRSVLERRAEQWKISRKEAPLREGNKKEKSLMRGGKGG